MFLVMLLWLVAAVAAALVVGAAVRTAQARDRGPALTVISWADDEVPTAA